MRRAGECPVAISAELGIAPITYYRWVALLGLPPLGRGAGEPLRELVPRADALRASEAEKAGDEARVERLLAALKLQVRHARDYEKLERAAYKEMSWEEQIDLETEHLTDEELAEEVSRLIDDKMYLRKS